MIKKLNVGERLSILQILPVEGNFVTLKLIRDLKAKVGLNAEEFETYNIIQTGSTVTWNASGNEEKEIDFREKEIDIISEELKKLNDNKKLLENQFNIYEKFVIGE